jgi:purine-binding chemotaxis protein CheW
MSSPNSPIQLVVFRLQTHEFALPVGEVAEVLRMVALTPVPEAPSWLPGVINLRGHVIPVVDLRLRLGVSAPAPGLDTPILVIRVDQMQFGAIADAMVEVLTLPGEAVEAIAGTDNAPHTAAALARTGDRLIVVLDVHQLQVGIPVIT